jgi:hypothetical protein
MVRFVWYYFKYWLLPATLVCGALGWQADTVQEYMTVAYGVTPSFLRDGIFSVIFVMPPAVASFIFIPHGFVYPFIGLAAFFGQVGMFVGVWLLCNLISPPQFLLADEPA